MTEREVKEKVLKILAEICDSEMVLVDTGINLDEENLIDSMGYTELLVTLEEEMDIFISPSEYARNQFDTPDKIVAAVYEKYLEL